jgi:purine-binding chemotaxis protein CheW
MAVSSALEQGMQIVVFGLADEAYGIDIFRVNEIIRSRNVTPVPRTVEYVKGLINLRGKTVPVVDLRIRLGLPATEATDATRIIVVETGEGSIGLAVDSVTEVIALGTDAIEEAPQLVSDVDSSYILGVGRYRDRLITLLDVDKVTGVASPA